MAWLVKAVIATHTIAFDHRKGMVGNLMLAILYLTFLVIQLNVQKGGS